jgi:hypothetical protein
MMALLSQCETNNAVEQPDVTYGALLIAPECPWLLPVATLPRTAGHMFHRKPAGTHSS